MSSLQDISNEIEKDCAGNNMKYYNNLHWEVLRGLKVGRLTLPNKLKANVLCLSHSYKVIIDHPLAKEQTFNTERQVDEYISAMSKLGEYNA